MKCHNTIILTTGLLLIPIAGATNLAMDTTWLHTHEEWKKQYLKPMEGISQITITCQNNQQVNGYYQYWNLNKQGTSITSTITIYNACQLSDEQLTEVWEHELKHHTCKMQWTPSDQCQLHWQI